MSGAAVQERRRRPNCRIGYATALVTVDEQQR
jgi:hypothetical protein